MTKLLILDRDGVINFDSKHYIKSPDEWHPIPGSIEAIAELTKAGFQIAIATNQSGVGRGLYSLDTLTAIHQKMLSTIRDAGGDIAVIFYCTHTPDDFCTCRKPEAGMFYQIRDYFQCDLKEVWAVGDSKRDLLASEKMHCQPVLVKTGNGAALLASGESLPRNCLLFDDLRSVATALCQNKNE